MQSDLFRCSCKSQPHGLQLHVPNFLVYCPHCLCQGCLQNVFLPHSSQGLRCPGCDTSLPSTLNAPEDLPTNSTPHQLLQKRPKATLGHARQPVSTLKRKNVHEYLPEDQVRKKQKTQQEVDEKLVTLQESVTQQFLGMRRMLHTPQNIDENLFAEITTKLKEMLIETEGALNRIIKTGEPQGLAQKASHGESQIVDLTTGSTDEMEEEFDNEEAQLIQETNIQLIEIEEEEPKLKLDFSNKDISDAVITTLCSEDFWTGLDKKKIYHLGLNFSSSTLTDEQFLKLVQNIMSPMKNLTSLVVNLAKTQISNESIQILSHQCLKNYKLKSFGLKCSEILIGKEELKSLDDGLNSSTSTLENLEIIFDDTCLQGEKFLDVLSEFEKLKHLKLSFQDSQISSEIVSSIVLCLGFLVNTLENLDLNLNGTEIDDEGLENFSYPVVSQMEKLKHLELYLGGTWVSNDFLWDLFQGLAPLAACLETLELDLHYTELCNSSFKEFCEDVLAEMRNIEHLKLDLSETKITDTSLKSLILPVCELKSLALNLSKNKIHDSGLQSFKENNNFQNIKSIDIQVKDTDVTDAALQDLLSYAQKGSPQHQVPSEYDPEDHSEEEPENESRIYREREGNLERKVYAELKKELNHYYGRRQEPDKLSTPRVSKSINKLSPETYNQILNKILTETLALRGITGEEVERWKETIQTMIASRLEFSSQTPRKRRARKQNQNSIERKQVPRHSINDELLSELVLSYKWLKKYEREICFREKVIKILKSMKTRSFSVLHKKLLAFIRKLSKTYKTWRMSPTLGNAAYSSNWWYRFIGRDQEITDLWGSLPSSQNLGKQENNGGELYQD